MRFLITVLLIAVFSMIAGMFLPWWSIAIVAFIACFLLQRSLLLAFAAGFAGVFLLWGFLSLWIDLKNENILSQKIALVFPLGGSSLLLILVTAFVGGLVAGFAGMTGGALHPILSRK